MGIAFLTVSIILGVSGMGRGWWFWMLIPAFGMIGSGIAKYIQLKKLEQPHGFVSVENRNIGAGQSGPGLPPSQTEYISPQTESRFKTGDLVPPSVTDNTTRQLEMDSEGQTMALPKK